MKNLEMAGQAVLDIQMEAILTGGKRRLRPIMMTTLTTCLALVPMALGFGEGSESEYQFSSILFFIPSLSEHI